MKWPRRVASRAAHQPIARQFGPPAGGDTAGQVVQVLSRLKQYETVARAASADYRVQWGGSTVLGISPAGLKSPLYTNPDLLPCSKVPFSSPRYSR